MSEGVKTYKKLATEEAVRYLADRKAARKEGPEAVKAFNEEQKQKKAEYLAIMPELDKNERKARKKGYRAFKKRKNRTTRAVAWILIFAMIAAIAVVTLPTTSMISRVLSSQKYYDDSEQAIAVKAKAERFAADVCEEGFVLLKNDDNVLPLDGGKVAIFGDDAYNFVYGGSGSAGADQKDTEDLFTAFENAGIEYDETLNAAYKKMGVRPGGSSGGIFAMLRSYFAGADELEDWHLPDDDVIAEARDFTDTAVIVLSSQEVEGNEINIGLLQIMGSAMPNRAELIDKVCDSFEHVIFIINSGNVMELGFVNDYDSADAVLWVGAPGAQGCSVIVDVLLGKVNPSGRTVDTWPVSIEDEPSYASYGDYKYDNLDMYTMEYSEGIYVGYRYYETRYGADDDEYWEHVVFPFGSGLSYTTFDQKLVSAESRAGTTYITVLVTNTGSAAGKSVVELYFMPPWYKNSEIEKSAVELGAYAKTDKLKPGESQALELSISMEDMASYSEADGCFMFELGDYVIALADNAHDALYSDELTFIENPVDKLYESDTRTRNKVSNLFDFAEGKTEYLSRKDFKGTFPESKEGYYASGDLLDEIEKYNNSGAKDLDDVAFEENNGIILADLEGLDYNDPAWDDFLDQFSVNELIRLCANGGWHTEAIDRLEIPQTKLLDGPSGWNSMYSPLEAASYPMEVVVASTWNNALAYEMGEIIGFEANIYGINGWYAPAVNLHRSSIGGRNSEYFSEDPLIAGKMAAAMIQGVQSRGVVAVVKHLVCNDVELNARNGIYIWVDQQALRELYLEAFEIAIKEGKPGGVMSSFTHLGYKWCGASSELLQDLLRTEWGFKGFVTTDAVLEDWMSAELAVENGNDLMLEMGLQQSEKALKKAYKEDPIEVGSALRSSAHNICYAIVNCVKGVL